MLYNYGQELVGKNILITPLNWGLGHSTRCIPIIREAIKKANSVTVGSDGAALDLLKGYFPDIEFIELASYNVRYKYSSMLVNGFLQLPSVLSAIRKEKIQVDQIVLQKGIDVIISDNRFGCYHEKCKSIFITHQLNIQYSNPIVQKILNFQNRYWINRFDETWVPDYSDSKLSGKLSQSNNNSTVNFIGPLSIHQPSVVNKKYDILILLSGPEPQRTILHYLLWKEIEQLSSYEIAFVAGKSGLDKLQSIYANVDFYSLLVGDALTQIINQSRLVIARSGYSTIMDLQITNSKALYIPTPGQTEQRYLAHYHKEKFNTEYILQKDIERYLIKKVKAILK